MRKEKRAEARASVIKKMGALHGLPQKLGQVLATVEVNKGHRYYTPLTAHSSTHASQTVNEIVKQAVGSETAQAFSKIREESIEASIAQVYCAQLKETGQAVAIKIKHPRIEHDIEYDLKALGWLSTPANKIKKGFNLNAYHEEIGDMIRQEIDFDREGQHIDFFHHKTRSLESIETPQYHRNLSNSKAITMSWIEGEPFEQACQWSISERKSIAQTLLLFFVKSCFEWKRIHADPHPGNFRFRQTENNPVVSILDFGCVQEIDGLYSNALQTLILSAQCKTENCETVFQAYLDLGFDKQLLEPFKEKLLPLTQILFEPFCHNGYCLSDWKLSERIAALLGEYRSNFRFAGPANSIYFIRAFQGLFQYLKALEVPIDGRQCIEPYLNKDFLAMNIHTTGKPSTDTSKPLSSALRILVREQQQDKVSLTFKPHLAGSLESIIPDEMMPKLSARSINLKTLSQRASANNYAPSELFRLEENGKLIHVWLE